MQAISPKKLTLDVRRKALVEPDASRTPYQHLKSFFREFGTNARETEDSQNRFCRFAWHPRSNFGGGTGLSLSSAATHKCRLAG
jgi:hypothetical protein